MKKFFLTIGLLLWAVSSNAADITWADKTTGGQFTAADANEIKTAVNSKADKQPSTLALTTDTSISEAQLLANKYITNQGIGSGVELDITLPAVSYYISATIIVTEAEIIETCPPSGEAVDLGGTTLDANDCVDSPAVVGSKMVITRMQNAAGTWHWSFDAVRGSWVDTGATD